MSPDAYTEKVSVNINASTLSSIDLLVDGGYYSNRSDFINQALREGLQRQQSTIDRLIEKNEDLAERTENQWFIGVSGLTAEEIAAMDAQGVTTNITGYGVFCIDGDADRETLYRVVKSIRVKGKAVMPRDVKEHYGVK